MASSIHFPELQSYRIEHVMPLTAIVGVTAAIMFPYALWVGLICLGIAMGLLLPMLWKELGNAHRRRRWVRSFGRQIHPADIGKLRLDHPDRYRLHVRNYQGFGMNTIKPAALIEDTTTGACFPVVPPVTNVYALAELNSIAVEHH